MADLTHGSHSSSSLGGFREGPHGRLALFFRDFCSFSAAGHELTAFLGRFSFTNS
jgi:hypothetical protein